MSEIDLAQPELAIRRPPTTSPVEYLARAIAFYLPQFHPIPENDAWWGPGFSEWTNTAKARPLYRGHPQPHIPADLGFYDLRLAESRSAQAALARRYGVAAFCYWHYWFGNGRQILQRPLQEVLSSGQPEIPFCVAWANQTWTGVWHGAEDRVLVEQTYPGPEDDQAHFDHLLPAFTDPRYLTVDGRPLFYVFRPEQLPDASSFTRRWRQMARAAGLPGLYLVAEVSDLHGDGSRFVDPVASGFDAGTYMRLPAENHGLHRLKMRLRRKLLRHPERYRYAAELAPYPPEMAQQLLPTVYPNWDNTPRSGRRGLVLEGTSPDLFRRHILQATDRLRDRPADERLLFVKSWNEWAEGNYLEPDIVHGHDYLHALLQGLTSDDRSSS